MNSFILKIILLLFLVMQAGCELNLKRKYNADEGLDSGNTKSDTVFSRLEKEIIRAYFNDRANNRILHYAVKRSPISKKQNEKLRVFNYIPSDIQIVPLPIRLDNKLSQIPLSLLRVQVGKNIILMKVNSRKILDIVKL